MALEAAVAAGEAIQWTPATVGTRVKEIYAEKVRFILKNLHFLLKNDDFLLKNDGFLLKNDDFLLKNDEFIIKQNPEKVDDVKGLMEKYAGAF